HRVAGMDSKQSVEVRAFSGEKLPVDVIPHVQNRSHLAGPRIGGQTEITTPKQALQKIECWTLPENRNKSAFAEIHGCSPTFKVISPQEQQLTVEVGSHETRTKLLAQPWHRVFRLHVLVVAASKIIRKKMPTPNRSHWTKDVEEIRAILA